MLNKVPPYQLGEQIVAEAQRLPGISSTALYVVDLDGASMQRLAGAATFPAQVTAPWRSARHSRLDVGDREFLLERWDNA